jgi:thioredoxin:protein disulfide reductase
MPGNLSPAPAAKVSNSHKAPWILLGVFFLGLLLGATKAPGEPLKPEQAFSFQARFLTPNLIEIELQAAPGYHLYKDKLKFKIEPGTVTTEPPQFPAGQIKEDPYFGKQEVFRGRSSIRLPLKVPLDQKDLTLLITYQGCSDNGLCYPPKTQKITLAFPPGPAGPKITPPAAPQAKEPTEDATGIASLFGRSSYGWIILSFFGFGLLLSLTPCVFPMVPIISCIIMAQGQALSRWRAFALSATYVMGMSLAYSAVGVIAGLSGRMFTAALQNPWVLGAFALIFVALAFCMFGFFDLQVPPALQNRMTSVSNRLRAGTFFGVFLMGLFSAVIVGPCVSAPLAGALVYISRTNNVWLGGSALFALSLGMGVPLLVVGTSAGVLLPRAGQWMNGVKSFFGVVLLAAALWMLTPVFSPVLLLGLWGAFLVILSVYLQALDPLPPGSGGLAKFGKGIGIIALICGTALLIGALMGGQDPLQPLSGLRHPSGESSLPQAASPQASGLPFHKLTDPTRLDAQIKENRGHRVLLFFSADWCVSCRELKEFTFKDPRVRERLLKDWKLLQADITETNDRTEALLKQFGLFGPPAVLFFDEEGKEIPGTRVIGYEKADDFLKTLGKIQGKN